MKTLANIALGICLLSLLALVARAGDEPVSLTDTERRRILQHSPLGPPPPVTSNARADDDAAARLGQMLFFEERLSSKGVACATCHVPSKSFSDARKLSAGVQEGTRNTPSLWNVAHNRWFFWDGRADSLWAQALVPIESETEMAGDRVRVVRLVAEDAALRSAYTAVFGPLPDVSGQEKDSDLVATTFSNVGRALEAYERRLVSRGAPFDRFVEGLREEDPSKTAALSPAAVRGLKLFVGRANCRQCHSGANFTDGEFHRIGLPARTDGTRKADSGRYGGIDALLRDPFNAGGERMRTLRRSPESWGQFKTPSLRNVAKTAPYMHDGETATLRDALRHYSTLEGVAPGDAEASLTPLRLTEEETDALIAFLESLTDESLDPALLVPSHP